MKFLKRHLWALLLVLLGAGTARAQVQSEIFAFSQGHDTTFGQNLFLGPFSWFAEGDGARGDRISTNGIASIQAVGFNLFLEDSCVGPNGAMVIELYVNDRKVGETPMPPFILCNSTPAAPISASFDISGNPIAGTGVDRTEYEFRIQLRGVLPPVAGFTFYKIDTSNSNIGIAGVSLRRRRTIHRHRHLPHLPHLPHRIRTRASSTRSFSAKTALKARSSRARAT